MNLKSWAQSSTSPEQLSATIQGAILGASVLIIWVAHTFLHLEIGASDITAVAIQLGAAAAALWTVFGLVRKLVMRGVTA